MGGGRRIDGGAADQVRIVVELVDEIEQGVCVAEGHGPIAVSVAEPYDLLKRK